MGAVELVVRGAMRNSALANKSYRGLLNLPEWHCRVHVSAFMVNPQQKCHWAV